MWRNLLALIPLLFAQLAFAQTGSYRYALILDDAPLVRQGVTKQPDGRRLASEDAARKLEAAQDRVRQALAEREIRVENSTKMLLNAVYVSARADQEEELKRLPGVHRVERLRPWKLHMDRALDLANAPAGWNAPGVGGRDNAGAGIKIGILDTGIDHTHPAFQDPSLNTPAGYPRCVGADCAYTSNKVIAARSYVRALAYPQDPQFSRPDDLSPRDRVGHGTALAMIAAGTVHTGPRGLVSGVAPKAWLGSYKVFGSPGVNDSLFIDVYDDVVFQALGDALVDGMDVVVMPFGTPADWGPEDRGAVCGLNGNERCDFRLDAIDDAVGLGMTVVISAGNDGDIGVRFPTESSLSTPGTAPSAITVGASTNSHIYYQSVRVTGNGVPSNLLQVRARFGDGPLPASPLTAPLRDAAASEPNALACNPLGAGTMTGAIALIERGECAFVDKILNVQRAGAVGAIVMEEPGYENPIMMTGLAATGIPAVMIGNLDGQALRTFLQSNPGRPVSLDPAFDPVDADFDTVASFSSRGPVLGSGAIKPEVVAVGTDLLAATQDYDPNSPMWSPARYSAVDGTSFAAPMVGGAVAVLKQLHPNWSEAQIKSAVVNTANPFVDDFTADGARIAASVTAMGAGKLDLDYAARTNITAEPSTLSFGFVGDTLPPPQTLWISNLGSQAASLTLSLEPADNRLTLDATSFVLPAGQARQVVVTLNQMPPAGRFEGFLMIRGGAVELGVPFLYTRGDGIPYNSFPLSGLEFSGNVNEPAGLLFKVIDFHGAGVSGLPIQIEPRSAVSSASDATDLLGIGEAEVIMSPNPGEEVFSAKFTGAPDLTVFFYGRARLRPTISMNGVVNAASGDVQRGLAPGSYISIYGSALSEATRAFTTNYLPVSLSEVSVSFDVAEVSVPGRIHFISPNQINVQIPWELQGRNDAWMKVSIGPVTESALYSVPLNSHSPGFFQISDPGGTGRLVAAALDESFRVIGSNNPVRRGRVAQLFVNGLGPVDNTPPSGELTPPAPLARTLSQPVVTVGGWTAGVQFSGLAPYNVGLYQLNIVVPAGLQAGLYPVAITIGGVTSKEAFLYVGE
mgnify:CR=1 FL=1